MKLIPKNWSEFQQYKDRKPQWIKLHRELLNDFSYSNVQIGTKATLPLLWLLACEYDDGIIDASIEEIAFRIHIDADTVNTAIEELLTCKFFTTVQDCTEVYKSVPREEKRREEKETKKELKKTKIDNTKTINDLSDIQLTELKTKIDDFVLHVENECFKAGAKTPKCLLDYDDFVLSLKSSGRKYSDFWATYQTWHRNGIKKESESRNGRN